MANNALDGFLRGLRRGALGGEEATDGDLLQAYVNGRDESAFEALLRRHGPMVLGVCLRVLRNEADAEDAFQATFLVLVRQAARIRPGGPVAPWLHGVARNTAMKARAMGRKRAFREREAGALPRSASSEEAWLRAQARLDEAVGRLPEKYRAPIVLCELEGKSIQDAARELGCPQGTLATRLSRGRALLRKRLETYDLAPSGGHALALPPALLASTAEAARLLQVGEALTGVVRETVVALLQRETKNMLRARIVIATAVFCLAACLLGAAWGWSRTGEETQPDTPPPAREAGARGDRELQAVWRLVEVLADGKKTSSLRLLLEGRTFHFEGDRFRVTAGGRDIFAPGARFTLDPTRTPRTIDLIVSRDGKTFTFLGIYAIEKDRLRLCISFAHPSKRPTKLAPDKAIGASVEVLERVRPEGKARTPAEELAAILGDWGRAEVARDKALDEARNREEREKARDAMKDRVRQLAERAAKVGEDDPDGPLGLAALCWAAHRSPGSAAGKKALTALEGKRLARADLGDLALALEGLRAPLDHEAEAERFGLAVIQRVRRELDHPEAARLLVWACTRSLHFRPVEVPRSFAGAAELIVERFATSTHLMNFCGTLGTHAHRPWARPYEKHLRTILKANPRREVRASAHIALARIVAGTGAARQDEALRLYRSFLKDFDGKGDGGPIESEYRRAAGRAIAEIETRGLGKRAAEIEGKDLDGKAMKLSDFRGKVVLLSFWGTWCPPCVAFIPHERALVARLKGEPFAVVGVNRDRYDGDFRAWLAREKVPWRSFEDRRTGRRAISEEWALQGWPTIYLIDHTGTIRGRWGDVPDAKELDEMIDHLVAEAKRGP